MLALMVTAKLPRFQMLKSFIQQHKTHRYGNQTLHFATKDVRKILLALASDYPVPALLPVSAVKAVRAVVGDSKTTPQTVPGLASDARTLLSDEAPVLLEFMLAAGPNEDARVTLLRELCSMTEWLDSLVFVFVIMM